MLEKRHKDRGIGGDVESPALRPHLTLTLFLELIGKKWGRVKRLRKGEKKLKKIAFALLGGFLFLLGSPLRAEEKIVPHLINFQSVLKDPAGVPLPDGLHDVLFRLIDVKGEELYRERQTLESQGGVVSAMIGSQGGLESSHLDPARPSFLGVTVGDSPLETLLEIVSVPYSIYSEVALSAAPQSIGQRAIIPKSITADLLAEDVLEKLLTGISKENLPSFVVSREELGGVAGASGIGVDTNFIYSRGPNLQGVLKDMDIAIHQRQTNLERQKDSMDAKMADLEGAQTNLQSELADANRQITNLQNGLADANRQIVNLNQQLLALNNNLNVNVANLEQNLSETAKLEAWGIVEANGDVNPPLGGQHNIGGVLLTVDRFGNSIYQISFAEAIPTPYSIVATTIEGPNHNEIVVVVPNSQTNEGFSLRTINNGGSAVTTVGFHFAVMK